MVNAAGNADALGAVLIPDQCHVAIDASNEELQDRLSTLTRQLEEAELSKERQRLETALVSNRLVRLLELLPGAVLVIDGEGVIRECNTCAEEILHTPLLGCAWSVIVNREFSRGASFDGELKQKGGRWLSLARSPLGTEPGEILLLADITESRRTAELLQRAERLSSLGEMSARLGHQIRTPLATAVLYASNLCDEGASKQKASAQKIRDCLRDLGSTVDDMLCFAAGAKQPGETIRVRELLQDAAETIAPQLKRGSQLTIEVSDPGLAVFANRKALQGALLNLITNAGQASEACARIELSAVRSAGQICLTVADDGPGVREDIRTRLFDPFFTTRPQGTGLGLAVVRTVAEAHGGEVMLECGPQGTAFSICLPASTHPDTVQSNYEQVDNKQPINPKGDCDE